MAVYKYMAVYLNMPCILGVFSTAQELLNTRPGHMGVSQAVYSHQNAKNMHFSSATLALNVHNHNNQSKTQLQHL